MVGVCSYCRGQRSLENRASYFSKSSVGVKGCWRTSTIKVEVLIAIIVAIYLNNTRTWESVVLDLSLEFSGEAREEVECK